MEKNWNKSICIDIVVKQGLSLKRNEHETTNTAKGCPWHMMMMNFLPG